MAVNVTVFLKMKVDIAVPGDEADRVLTAIGDAARMIKDGDADVMLAGGAEAAICPIGIAGITNKAPAVIAASVCAQLLGVWEQEQAGQQQPRLTLVTAHGG